MSQNFDFNIDNYSTDNLISFFKLHNNYSVEDLDKKAKQMTLSIVGSDNSSKYKYNLIEFIQQAQEILIKVKNDDNAEIIKKCIKSIAKTVAAETVAAAANTPIDNIGKIINPLSSHPSMQTQRILSNTANPYNNVTDTANYIFNTLFRDDFFNSNPNNCSFTIPSPIKNVVGICLSGIQIPNVTSTFSEVKRTNELYIFEDVTGNEAIVALPPGNYVLSDLVVALEKAINIQVIGSWPNRFTVTVVPNKNRIVISNSTYPFNMNIIKKNRNLFYPNTCLYDIDINTNADDIDPKKNLKPSDLYNTMGYLLGYRSIEYIGLQSYEAESIYVDTLQDYYYFVLNDYTDYQPQNTFGVLPTGFVGNNIIAILPITTPKYVASFDNNSNFIYKTRNYFAPVNIKKISIKFLGPQGELIDLKSTDFAFCLQVSTLHDNVLPYQPSDALFSS
jgi:hypothetical protein